MVDEVAKTIMFYPQKVCCDYVSLIVVITMRMTVVPHGEIFHMYSNSVFLNYCILV